MIGRNMPLLKVSGIPIQNPVCETCWTLPCSRLAEAIFEAFPQLLTQAGFLAIHDVEVFRLGVC